MRWTEEEYQEFLNKKSPKPKKKSKYRNVKTTVDGITFDSKREAEYYCQLKILKQAGEIKDFGLQPRYELQPTFRKNGTTHRSITYVADFVVVNNDGTTEVIDVKGVETKDFKIKKKLFEYKYPDLSLKIIK
ncbi:DUF1064 domain-containing protein [Tissierella sp.]|uniref:DUF1064 domain-containing protein n=1 Tax=Tissierella sp. TaxID=41274 RepID=UPI0028554341|nr:DUF1064 domain-containing protein [Tissierella sp.]MDR7856328.1 DUF1064 domain-containing protein [Tissierella sp.]